MGHIFALRSLDLIILYQIRFMNTGKVSVVKPDPGRLLSSRRGRTRRRRTRRTAVPGSRLCT